VTWLALKLSHKWHDFWEKLWKNCFFFFILSANCLKQFSFKEVVSLILQKLHKHLHVKYQLFLSHFSKTPIILTDFRKILIKFDTFEFNENVSSGSRVVPHRETDEQPGRHDEAHNQFLQFCKCNFQTDGKFQY